MEIYVKFLLFPYFCSLFLVFKHNLMVCVDFTRIAASNTASDDVTNYVTHRIFNTYVIYSCAHVIVKIDEKFILNGGYKYDL